MNNHPHIEEESDDAERTEGVLHPTTATSDSGETFAEVDTTSTPSQFEVKTETFTVVVNNTSTFTNLTIRFNNPSEEKETPLEVVDNNYSSFFEPSKTLGDTKTFVEVLPNTLSKGLEVEKTESNASDSLSHQIF